MCPNLGAILREVDQEGEFKGCATLVKKHTVQLLEEECQNSEYAQAFTSATKSVNGFLKKITENFSNRLQREKERNPLFQHIDYVFDMIQMIKFTSVPENIESSLKEYFTLAQKAGSIERNIEFEIVKHQYEQLSNRVRNEYQSVLEQPVDCHPMFNQCNIYAKFFNTPELYKDIPEILHLALTAVSRTH